MPENFKFFNVLFLVQNIMRQGSGVCTMVTITKVPNNSISSIDDLNYLLVYKLQLFGRLHFYLNFLNS